VACGEERGLPVEDCRAILWGWKPLQKDFEANQDILSDPNLIKVGQKIKIP
jgi:hypothetical protein